MKCGVGEKLTPSWLFAKQKDAKWGDTFLTTTGKNSKNFSYFLIYQFF